MDMDMQQGHEHAAGTWTFSMDMNVGMQHVFFHAACPCCMFLFVSMLHVQVIKYFVSVFIVHVRVYNANPCLCCMSMSICKSANFFKPAYSEEKR
jgi:hypothetical protein